MKLFGVGNVFRKIHSKSRNDDRSTPTANQERRKIRSDVKQSYNNISTNLKIHCRNYQHWHISTPNEEQDLLLTQVLSQ